MLRAMDPWQLGFWQEVAITFFILIGLPFSLVFGAVWLAHRDEAAAQTIFERGRRPFLTQPHPSPTP